MEKAVEYLGPERALGAADFLTLVDRVWPGQYDEGLVERALARTTNFTAWHAGRLVGCAQLLSDGYLFSTVPEILVDPEYRRKGVGAELMRMLWEASPTSLGFGVQAGNEAFFEALGFEAGMAFYHRRKPGPA